MKDERHGFARVGSGGALGRLSFTAAAFTFGAFACVSSTSTPPVTTQDAGVIAPPDAAVDAYVAVDAGTDATTTDAAKEAATAIHADVTKDFGTTSNPNGAWTYGYTAGDPTGTNASALVVFPHVSNDTPNIPAWNDPNNINLGAPAAWRNDSGVTNTNIAAGEFAMHPGKNGEYAVVRWTAPAAGTYAISLQFGAGDIGDTNGLLLHNGVVLASDDATATETVHTMNVTLAAGDRLEAAVGPKGDFIYDSTPVRFKIDSAP